MFTQVKRLLPATFAVALSFVATTALAQDKGFYVGGQAGVSIPQDSDYDLTGSHLSADLDTGWAAGLGFGYAYGNGFRGEMEFNYHANDVNDISGTSTSGADVQAYGLMVNGYYDFFTGTKFTPYVGIGFGGAHVNSNNITPSGGSTIDDSDTGFAWQAMLGVGYAVTDNIRLTLGYRYFAVPDLDYTNNAGADVSSNYASHDIMLGVRFLFGAPAKPMPEPMKPAAAPMAQPAPAPAPAPMPKPAPAPKPAPVAAPAPKNFLVFFDWDKSTLTPQAQSIIRSAAAEAKRVGSARIRATGHTDRSGPTRYNQRLSMRRAVAVRNMLVKLGIPRNQITILAKGESEPLVPTADGVREPQNRRVEIVLE